MREIIFRGKRLDDNNQWAEGWYFQRWTGTKYKHFIIDGLIEHEIDESTLGQFTGLYDKNGKRVFEGDVILHRGDIKSYVIYNSAHCAYLLVDIDGNRNKCQCDKLGSYCSLWIEVIGTIHDEVKP